MASKLDDSPPAEKKIKIEEGLDAQIELNVIKEEIVAEEVIIKDEGPPDAPGLSTAQVVKVEKVDAAPTLILQFKITLLRGRGAPKIWRRFQVPANYNFHQFHIAIQRAMGWKSVYCDYHLHAFHVVNPSTGVREEIVTSEDLNWREDAKDELLTNITDYFNKKGQKGKYEYDFGMGWMHEFVFEKSFKPVEGETYPKCVEGAKACPLEDGNEESDYDSDAFNPEECFNQP